MKFGLMRSQFQSDHPIRWTIMAIFSGTGERFGQVEYFCPKGKTCSSALPTEVSDKIKGWKR
jgi:hypothetical protein